MSLQHLEFEIIHATGWDDNYPPEQLVPKDKISDSNNTVKHGKGWQSPRFCTYPQEIILRIRDGPARIRKLQILSHHYKIAQKLDIYVGAIQRRKEMVSPSQNSFKEDNATVADTTAIITAATIESDEPIIINDDQQTQTELSREDLSWDQMPKIVDNDSDGEGISQGRDDEEEEYHIVRMADAPYIHFRRLGYCALDSNERANYKARELKSVRLDATGEYIRLVARRFHSNHLNQYNQVGVVGITLMGERVDDCLDGESRIIPIENADDDPSSRVASPESCVVPILQASVPPSPTLSDPPKEDDVINFEDGNPFHSSNFLQNTEDMTKLLEAFSRAKETAVKVEDFYFAKILKTSMTIMEKGAEEIMKLDALKKQVVKEEDYDSAARYKACTHSPLFPNNNSQIEAIKSTVRDKIVDEGIEVDENGEVILIDPDIADIVGLADTRPTPSESQTHSPRGSLSNGKASPRDTPNTSPRSSLSGKHNSSGMTRTASSHSMTRNASNGSAMVSRTDGDVYPYQLNGHDELAAGNMQRSMSRKRSPSPLNLSKSRTNSNASNSNRHASAINKHDLDDTFGTSANSSAQVSPVSSEKTHSWTAVEDERPLPALEKVKPPVMPLPFEDELVDNEPEELSDLAKSAFAWSIDVFGDRVISCLLSKKFKLRESALFEVTRLIDIEKGVGLTIDEKIDKLALIKAAFQVMEEGLSDTREKLILQSIKLWDAITKFCVLHKTPNSATYKTVEQTYPKLFAKIADGNPRLKQAASDLFVMLCTNYRTPNQMLMSHVLKPALTQTQPPKQAKAKIELVMRLVDEFGVALVPKGKFDKDSAISLEGVMEVAVSYLNHSNGDVRDSATKLAARVCRYTEKENVEKYLDGVKPLLLETIWKLVEDQGPNRRRRPRQAQIAPPTMFELDEALLEKPLAKRGTVSRLQQQLMEARAMVNNVNHFVQDDYDAYLANSTKLFRHEHPDEVQKPPAAVESAPVEPKVAPQEVEKVAPEKKSSSAKTAKSTKSAPAAKKTVVKKKVDSSKSTVQSKTSSKSSVSARGTASKTPSRRGSAGEKSSSRPSTKTTNGKSGDSTSKASEDAGEDVKADGFCIFCDEQNDDFTEENLMTHYWNDCPVLTKCPLCNIILEISTLDDHMLTDCDKSKFVKQCPRCREVIPADSYLEHIAKQTCMLIPPHIVRCPLCKTVVRPATEAGWKAHLLDEEGCPKNIRKSTPTEKKLDKVDETSKEKRDRSKASPVGGSKTSSSSVKAPTRKSSGVIGKDKARKPSAKGGKLKSGV